MSNARQAIALLRSVGRARVLKGRTGSAPLWAEQLAYMHRRATKRASKALVKKAALGVADDLELRAAFEAVVRLGDASKVWAWLEATFDPKVPLPKEEALARRVAGRIAKAIKDEQHARAMLRAHEAALKREQRAVRKWRAKVRYYDRKREKPLIDTGNLA